MGDSALHARRSPAHYERRDDRTRHHERPHASLGESVDAGATKRHSVAIVTGIAADGAIAKDFDNDGSVAANDQRQRYKVRGAHDEPMVQVPDYREVLSEPIVNTLSEVRVTLRRHYFMCKKLHGRIKW